MPEPYPTVLITLWDGQSVGFDNHGRLIFSCGETRLSLGVITKDGIDALCSYLQQLKVHAKE